MCDFIFKLKVLYFEVLACYYNWKETCLRVNLSEQVCCNGYDCGCQAIDYRLQFVYSIQKDKEFIRSHK